MDQLIKKINKLVNSERMTAIVLTSVIAVQKNRIWQLRQDSKGGRHKGYSPAYLNFKKKKKGFQGTAADLQLTGDLLRSYQFNRPALTFGFSDEENEDKAQWLEKRQESPIFELGQSELKVMDKIFQSELNKVFK